MNRPRHILDADFLKGGPGSGNFGHAGRPGERGGSAPDGSGGGGAAQKPTAASTPAPRYSAKKWTKITQADLPSVKEHFQSLGFSDIDIIGPDNFDPVKRPEAELRLTNAMNLASEMFTKYRNEGFPIPPKLTIGMTRTPGEIAAFGFPGTLAEAGQDFGEFHIAYSNGYWHDPVGTQKEAYAHREHSSDDPAHTMHHEFGHYLHYTKSPYRFYTMSYDINRHRPPPGFNPDHYHKLTTITGNLGINIIKHVSSYALSSPAEFVAETFAGMQSGKKYPKNIMKYYKLLGGPFKSDFSRK